MTYYKVSFEKKPGVYCYNIAVSESRESVEDYYSSYAWVDIEPAAEEDISSAEKRNVPFVPLKTPKPKHATATNDANDEPEQEKNNPNMEHDVPVSVESFNMTEVLQARLLYSSGRPVYQAGIYYRLDPGGFVWSCPGNQYTNTHNIPWAFTGYRVQL